MCPQINTYFVLRICDSGAFGHSVIRFTVEHHRRRFLRGSTETTTSQRPLGSLLPVVHNNLQPRIGLWFLQNAVTAVYISGTSPKKRYSGADSIATATSSQLKRCTASAFRRPRMIAIAPHVSCPAALRVEVSCYNVVRRAWCLQQTNVHR